MRRLVLISIDVLLVAFATVTAVMLRGDFSSFEEKIINLAPYISVCLVATFFVFLISGLDRTLWRYSSIGDYLQIIVLTSLALVIALVINFALNRLAEIARSFPVLQGGLIVIVLVFTRVAARFWRAKKIYTKENGRFDRQTHETILVVGVNTVTELFLLSVKEFGSHRVHVVGILAEDPTMRGRAIHQVPILGTVEELRDILRSVEVHGIAVDRIVVASAADRLRPHALDVLLAVEESSNIVIQFLSEQLGLVDSSKEPSVLSGRERGRMREQRAVARVGGVTDHRNSTQKSFWLGKRIVDIFGATFLACALAPVLIFIAVVAALDVGFPVIFWQQRPGLYGRPFKLYKFRTMRAPHDKHKKRIPDDQRSSAIGQLLRRTRLDELPQLYNVLIGDMSLIGPRPLLPCDQSPDYVARLSVRPGITGWAQVNGGRIISTSDKLILDVWYVQNASLIMDFKILLGTLKMILFGDQINIEAVNQARTNLGLKSLLRTTLVPAE